MESPTLSEGLKVLLERDQHLLNAWRISSISCGIQANKNHLRSAFLFGSPLAGMIDCLFRYFHDPINSKKKTPETAIVSGDKNFQEGETPGTI